MHWSQFRLTHQVLFSGDSWLNPASWRQAAARGLLARATRVELPHEHSAAAAPPVHSQGSGLGYVRCPCAAAGAQPGSEPGGQARTEPGIHAPIRVEPARGCVTTLEAIARCACRIRVLGSLRGLSMPLRKSLTREAGCGCLQWHHASVGRSL